MKLWYNGIYALTCLLTFEHMSDAEPMLSAGDGEVGDGGGITGSGGGWRRCGGGSMLIHNCLMALNMFKQTVSKVSLSRVKKWCLCIINMSTRSIKLKCESVNYGLSSSTGKFSQ